MDESWKTFREAFKQSWNKVFRYGCYLVIFEFLTLAAGIAIWMICHGLWMIGLRLVIYWKPARAWLMRLMHVQDENYLQTPPFAWHRLIILTIYFSFAGFLIYLGTKIISNRSRLL